MKILIQRGLSAPKTFYFTLLINSANSSEVVNFS